MWFFKKVKGLIWASILIACLALLVKPAKVLAQSPCEGVFADPDSFAYAITKGLTLGAEQGSLLNLYLKNKTPYPDKQGEHSLQSVYDILHRETTLSMPFKGRGEDPNGIDLHPKLLKPAFREYVIKFPVLKKTAPKSLKNFIASFRKSAGQINSNLFRIEDNYGWWINMLGFSSPPEKGGQGGSSNKKALKQEQKGPFFAWLNTTALNQETRALCADTSIPYRERAIKLYKALEEIRSNLTVPVSSTDSHPKENGHPPNEKILKNISQAMAYLVHTVGFGNLALTEGLKSQDPDISLSALRDILNERDIMAFDLGFKGHFKELKKALGSKIPDETKMLQKIQEDINSLTPLTPWIRGELEPQPLTSGESEPPWIRGEHKGTQVFRLRALSLQESPFRSCFGGDCATIEYFEKALDPNYIYFTLTNNHHHSTGHITVVLGTASYGQGKFIPVAFVDKIQNVQPQRLNAMLEGVRRSVKERGYVLALPKKVGEQSGLTNDPLVSGYVETKILPHLKNTLKKFKPRKHGFYFYIGFSRAEEGLDLLEFESSLVQPPNGENGPPVASAQITPGDLHSPTFASPHLSVKALYEPILKTKTSVKESEQLFFLSHLLNLIEIEGLNITHQYVRDHLEFVINNQVFSFYLRKKALWILLKLNIQTGQDINLAFLESLGGVFSPGEQKALIGELSNWKNTHDHRRQFITQLSLNEMRSMLMSDNPTVDGTEVLESHYGLLLDKALILRESIRTASKFLTKNQGEWSYQKLITSDFYKGILDTTYVLLEKGTDPNAKSDEGLVALMWATEHIAKILLNKGANPNITNNKGETALMWFAEDNNTKVAQVLISHLADVHIQDHKGETALMKAAEEGHLEMVQQLLVAGARIEATNNQGDTALMVAAGRGHANIVQTLLSAGGHIESQNRFGDTALNMASYGGHLEVVKILLAYGASVHVKDQAGWTTLMWPAKHGRIDIVKELLKALVHGNLDTQNSAGDTALIIAADKGHIEVVKALLAQGANPHVLNHLGSTALMKAKRMDRREVVKILKLAILATP